MAALTTFERIDLFRRLIFVVPLNIFINVAISTYLSWRRSLPIREFQTTALLRSFLSSFTPRQLAVVAPSGSAIYQKWLSSLLKTPEGALIDGDYLHLSTTLPSTSGKAHLHYLRPKGVRTSKILLFFHGGGFNAPLSRSHLNWIWTHVQSLAKSSTPMAAAVLEYGLTPEFAYPIQLGQARDALEHLFKSGYAPENIVLGGDSAGGNLTLALLGHLMHPQQSVKELKLRAPLAGAFLVSPWVTYETGTASFKEKSRIDMVNVDLIRHGSGNYTPLAVAKAEKDAGQGWAWALDASEAWWADLSSVVKRVYVSAGEEECFRDHILLLADKLKKGSGAKVDVQIELEPKQAHDHVLVLCFRSSNLKAVPVTRINEWLEKTLK